MSNGIRITAGRFRDIIEKKLHRENAVGSIDAANDLGGESQSSLLRPDRGNGGVGVHERDSRGERVLFFFSLAMGLRER